MSSGILRGRVALVTGSTSGIGLEISKALAREGCSVMINGFASAEEVARVTAEIVECGKEFSVRVAHNGADVSKYEQVEAMINECVHHFGALHIVINNAGMQRVATVDHLTPAEWDKVLSVNLSSVFYVTHAALPHLRKAHWGRIVNISSTHGLVASPGKSVYVASKHGVLGFTKVVALETAHEHITSNAICPGFVQTPLVEAQIVARADANGLTVEEETHRFLAEKHPTHRFTTTEQVASAVLFLCSPAADNMTGSHITMDGGWTAI